MNLRSVFKLVFSESAFLKAELDHIEAKRMAGDAYQPAEEFRDEALERIRAKRRNLLKSTIWITLLVSIGAVAAIFVNVIDPISWLWIRLVRAFSIIILAWAVWSKLGDVKTFKGETLLELTSQHLYRFSYSAGILIGSFALFLEGAGEG